MKLAALCASAGRHSALERSIGFFLAQDDKDSILVIFENSDHHQNLSLDISPEDRQRIILHNSNIDTYTGESFTSVGAIWQNALDLVPRYIDTIAIWNDDDYYLPNHISAGKAGIIRGNVTAYKPLKSIAMTEGGGFKYDSNNFESSIFVKKSHLLDHGFSKTDGDYDLQWVKPLIDDNEIYIDPTGPSTMIYDWGGDIPVYKVSGDMNNPDNFKNIRKGNNDHGDSILTPSDITKYYNDPELRKLIDKKVSIPLQSNQNNTGIIDFAKTRQPDIFKDKRILSVGPKDKSLGNSCLSIGEGDVDLEVPIYEFVRKENYDVIIANKTLSADSLLEHSIKNISSSLKVGGTLLLSIYGGNAELFNKYLSTSFFSECQVYQAGDYFNLYGIKAEISKNNDIKDLVFIAVQSDDRCFVWESEVQINNLRKYGLSDKFKVLVYWERSEFKKTINQDWLDLYERYPEVEFYFCKGETSDNVMGDKHNYASIVRPYVLKHYWRDNPDMQNKTVFYMDSDVIFIKRPAVEEMVNTQNCFVTNTGHYLNVKYMKDKIRELGDSGLDPYHFVDIAAKIVGITRQDILDNDTDCGGAQYVLKNVPVGFWDKVQEDTMKIRRAFYAENQKYFVQRGIQRGLSTENAGIQSWCADMWAVLYNLYYFKLKVKAPSFMDSGWATDTVRELNPGERLGNAFILHNTGVPSDQRTYQFDKVNYRAGNKYFNKFPYDEDLSYVSPDYLSNFYAKEIIETKNNKLK